MTRITTSQARRAGIVVPKAKRRKAAKLPVDDFAVFRAACRAAGLPEPTSEVSFDPVRKWRVDWMFVFTEQESFNRGGYSFIRTIGQYKLALEIDGGTWKQNKDGQQGGRHNRGQGFLKDIEKKNALTMAGIWLLRCTPQEMESGEAVSLVKRFTEARGL